jgi:hypothetical protein
LRLIPLIRILILLIVIVSKPVTLPHHRPQRTHQETRPRIKLHPASLPALLISRSEFLPRVVDSQDVVNASEGFPARDTGVGVVERGDAAVGVDGCEGFAFDAGGGRGEVPELDGVGYVEGLEQDGDFVGVWAGGVGVEGEGLEGGGRHFLWFAILVCCWWWCSGGMIIDSLVDRSSCCVWLLMMVGVVMDELDFRKRVGVKDRWRRQLETCLLILGFWIFVLRTLTQESICQKIHWHDANCGRCVTSLADPDN